MHEDVTVFISSPLLTNVYRHISPSYYAVKFESLIILSIIGPYTSNGLDESP